MAVLGERPDYYRQLVRDRNERVPHWVSRTMISRLRQIADAVGGRPGREIEQLVEDAERGDDAAARYYRRR